MIKITQTIMIAMIALFALPTQSYAAASANYSECYVDRNSRIHPFEAVNNDWSNLRGGFYYRYCTVTLSGSQAEIDHVLRAADFSVNSNCKILNGKIICAVSMIPIDNYSMTLYAKQPDHRGDLPIESAR